MARGDRPVSAARAGARGSSPSWHALHARSYTAWPFTGRSPDRCARTVATHTADKPRRAATDRLGRTERTDHNLAASAVESRAMDRREFLKSAAALPAVAVPGAGPSNQAPPQAAVPEAAIV